MDVCVFDRIFDNFKQQAILTMQSNKISDLNECYIFAQDFNVWVETIDEKEELILLKTAVQECVTANLFCNIGLYKHAMASLRLCLEHCLFAVKLSTNDFLLRKWKSGLEDMKWADVINEDSGVFSKTFIHAYAEAFTDRSVELNQIARAVYRECSEYIHGNFDKINSLPEESKFDENLLSQYVNCFKSMAYIISLCLIIRFNDEIIERDLLEKLEEPIMHTIGMLPEIQAIYDSKGV